MMRTAAGLLAVAIIGATALPFTFAEEPNTKQAEPQQTTPIKQLLTNEELAKGWISLFDGETLFGWRPNEKANWKIADGAIMAESGEPSLLCTTSQWGNFQLKLDFKTVEKGKAAVLLRTAPTLFAKTDSQTHKISIAGPSSKTAEPTGSLVDRQKANPTIEPSTDWQTMDVTADGPKIIVKINGQEILNYTDPNPLGRGFIGLQHRTGKIQFRNIKLRPLGTKSLFNGKNLAEWNTYPDMKSVVTVTEKGEINIKNGKGQLETKASFDDFTLQLEVFVNGKALNSGVFFRCIPGETMNGYESQIQNGFVDGDRSKPADCGTGGIFRRQDARYVNADDFTWFFNTIHADDNHVAVWVNGYQVCDWVDRRKPDKNPRRGLRLEPGTIMLQGHDLTTDLSFRNVKISKLPER